VKILGIETSCDETAAAVVENGRKVLSSVISSQIALHAKTGGVVPEVAAREHVPQMIPVIEEALKKADLKLEEIDAIAVTAGPGLLSSLIIGFTTGMGLAKALEKPLIPVHHVAGHMYANFLQTSDEIQFPFVTLTVSGGHNELYLLREHLGFEKLGETLDDAAGEAFDKVAVLLGLPYPGGPAISKVAKNGDQMKIRFPRARLGKESLDFSFSGLKTAVLVEVKAEFAREGKLSDQFIADCAASFQEAVCDVLVSKLLFAAKKYKVCELHLAGGVSANKRLRELLMSQIQVQKFNENLKVRFSQELSYCTDNAAMIAGVAYYYFQKNPGKYSANPAFFPNPQLHILNTFENEK